jgi:hypothetical protein
MAGNWGTDVPVSMPEPIDETEILLPIGDSHVFTPDGMKVHMSKAVRAEITSRVYRPVDQGDPAG